MTPIILKPRASRDARRLVVVDATVGWLLLALSWVGAGWLGYVMLDSHANLDTRMAVLALVTALLTVAIALAARARRGVLASL